MKRVKRLVSAFLTIIIMITFFGCGEKPIFFFATDLEDGKIVMEAEYEFQASATCNLGKCKLEVTCNGIILEKTASNKYHTRLNEGENEIILKANINKECETRKYIVISQGKFKIETDIKDQMSVDSKDWMYKFNVTTTYRDEPCEKIVSCNNKIISSNDKKNYSVFLENEKNVIEIKAVCGEKQLIKKYTVFCHADALINTTLQDGKNVTENNYSFKVEGTYKNQPCKIVATINEITLKANDKGIYDVLLEEGENIIKISVEYGENCSDYMYSIIYSKEVIVEEFKIETDIEEYLHGKNILNGKIDFKANAMLGSEKCNLAVKHNGKNIEETGIYSVDLIEGKNTFVFNARKGDRLSSVKYEIDYNPVRVCTDLKEDLYFDKVIIFMAEGEQLNKKYPAEVYVNNIKLEKKDLNRYTYTFDKDGYYEFKIVAKVDNIITEKIYHLSYTSEKLDFSLFTLKDNEKYYGNLVTFYVVVKDGLGNKIPDKNISFAIDKNANDGKEEFIELVMGRDIVKIWSDDIKTSYRLNLKEKSFGNCKNKLFLLKTKANYNNISSEKIITMEYVGPKADGSIGDISFSMEAFTIGAGYIIEPEIMPIYENFSMASIFTELLRSLGYNYTNTGNVNDDFYLSEISGLKLEQKSFPVTMRDYMIDNNMSYTLPGVEGVNPPKDTKYSIESLGEFDFTNGSGWVYSINGYSPNFGLSACYPQDGDVIRIQFTLICGTDLGGSSITGEEESTIIKDPANYVPMMKLLNKITKLNYNGLDDIEYNKTLEKLTKWDLSQKEMDSLINNLKKVYGVN